MKDACVAVDVDDGELPLLNVAEVYYVVVMPAEFLARRKFVSNGGNLGVFAREKGERRAVPAMGSAQDLCGYYLCHSGFSALPFLRIG